MRLLLKLYNFEAIEAVVRVGEWCCGVLVCLCVFLSFFSLLCTVVLYASDCSCNVFLGKVKKNLE